VASVGDARFCAWLLADQSAAQRPHVRPLVRAANRARIRLRNTITREVGAPGLPDLVMRRLVGDRLELAPYRDCRTGAVAYPA